VSFRFARFTATWIGLRYLRTQRRQFASLITWVSIVGLALGVAVLVVVLSVMNGFDAELKRRILGLVPHVVVEPPRDRAEPLSAADAAPFTGIGAAFRAFQGQAMLARNGGVRAVAVYGIGAEGLGALDVLKSSVRAGRYEDLADVPGAVLLGAPLARYLGLSLGDSVTIGFSVPDGASVEPRLERFELAGVFEVGADLDYTLAVVSFDDIERFGLARAGDVGVRIVVDDPLDIDVYRERVAAIAPVGWKTVDWRSTYGDLFRAVRMEKGMMFTLLVLIVAIAAFNIVSAQSMLVNDKRADIAILRTMGAADGVVARIVLMHGVIVAVTGVAIGVALGLLLSFHVRESVGALEWLIGSRLLEGTYFDEIPVRVLPGDLAAVVGVSLFLCVASAWAPARRAAAVNPAEALHDA